MQQELRCHNCNKKLLEGNLALLVKQKHQEPREQPHIDALCHRCKTLNTFYYGPSRYVAK